MTGILIVGDQSHPRALERASEIGGDIIENPAAIDTPIGFISRCLGGTVEHVILTPDASAAVARDIEHLCSDLQIELHRVG